MTYYYRADDHYVVIDELTGQAIQFSDTTGFDWIYEMTNQVIHAIE